jgi:hypothetical protein
VATASRNYSIQELSKLLTERLQGPWHQLFVNSAWWLWHRNYKQTMSATIVASSLDLKDHAAARSARCAALDIGSIYYLASVAICGPAKTVDATDYRPFRPFALSSSKRISLCALTSTTLQNRLHVAQTPEDKISASRYAILVV